MSDKKRVTAEEIAHLADLTSTDVMLAYLHNDPKIDYLLEVKAPDLSLADVAIACMYMDEHLLLKWESDGSMEIHSTALIFVSNKMGNPPRVEKGMAVHCLRAEPLYIYKPTGQKYE